MIEQLQLIYIFGAVIFGLLSGAYFYASTDIFLNFIKQPFKYIATGIMCISAGVLLAAVITFGAGRGVEYVFYGIPLTVFFYILYIVGSLFIILGAEKFTKRPSVIREF